jgi:hypothetical protein
MFLEVWQEPDGQWRWRYVEPAADGRPAFELPSAEHYDTSEAAIEAAEIAYPGVPARLRPGDAAHPANADTLLGRAGRRDREGGGATWGGRLAAAARRAGIFALLVVAATAVSRWRRRRRDRRDGPAAPGRRRA